MPVVVMCCRPNESAVLSQHDSVADARDFAARVPCDSSCVGDHLVGWYESGHFCVDFTISPAAKPLSVQLLTLYPRPEYGYPPELWPRPTILNQPFGRSRCI